MPGIDISLRNAWKYIQEEFLFAQRVSFVKARPERMAFKWRWVNKMYNNSNVDDLQISGFLARVMDKIHEGSI